MKFPKVLAALTAATMMTTGRSSPASPKVLLRMLQRRSAMYP